jgi:Holliday junction resolvase-like predicted endonuclease
MSSLKNIVKYAQAHDRVCPQPTHWNSLWEMLRQRQQGGAGWEPSLPLILAAWGEASDAQKRERLLLHIHYADQHRVLEPIVEFLRRLLPDDWYYTNGQTANQALLLSEDTLKQHLCKWFNSNGWDVIHVAWGHTRGIDMVAVRNGKKWIVEVKGIGSLPQMRVNYFLCVLGETLQRMDDRAAKYSIALPDVNQFRNLWNGLPSLAKQRTQISALFVSDKGVVTEEAE